MINFRCMYIICLYCGDFIKINEIILLSDSMCTNCVVMLYFWSDFVVG